ncbi:MAG: hypothetical protein ACREOS_06275 [Candidatus Dormibacteraceae bacterium]
MRLEHFPSLIEVTLSRRNLLTLLAYLEGHPADYEATISLPGQPHLIVTAEPDDAHYSQRQPGPMNEETERFIAEFDRRSQRLADGLAEEKE